MFQLFPKRPKQKPAGARCLKSLFFKEKETAMAGPALLPTSCLKRGSAVWSPLSPFLSELVSCPGAGKQGQESSWEGWLGSRNGGVSPAHLPWSVGSFSPGPRVSAEEPPVT